MALSHKQKVLIVTGVLLAVFLTLDFSYFWANLRFMFSKPKNISQQATGNVNAPASLKMEPNTLIIDSLNIKAPVVYVSQKTEKVYQAALINGVVHFPGTADPGQPGNVYIFGHSSDYFWSQGHYKSVFAVLPRISKGAEILISDSLGNKFVYLVIDSRKVGAKDTSVLDQGGYKKKLLTLQTSWPIGTALARWVVVAEIKNEP